ncbi:MAG TPA: hypothetical protein QF624_07345 [Dehalococcoidia bacterium]|nr:hypothetical protein [Dehalococcoidia bacterium]
MRVGVAIAASGCDEQFGLVHIQLGVRVFDERETVLVPTRGLSPAGLLLGLLSRAATRE